MTAAASSRLSRRAVTHRLTALLFVVSVLMILPTIGPAASPAARAISTVETLHDALLRTMKAGTTLGPDGRYENLAPVVAEAFDLRKMVQVMTGRSWRKADDEARTALTQAFTHFTVANYAAQFGDDSGETFRTLGSDTGPGKTRLVRTMLTTGTRDVALTYVLRPTGDGQWRIIDVLAAAGISELARRRSEYTAVVKRGGIGALIDALNSKADGLLGR